MAKKLLSLIIAIGILLSTMYVWSAIQGVSGIATSNGGTLWTDVKDASVGDNLTSGVLVSGMYFKDGAGNFSMLRGSIANGINVIVTGGSINTTPVYSGVNFYSIKDAGLNTTAVNYAFGFTSKQLIIETLSTNTDDICINWTGNAVATCPAANTAGNDRIPAGRIITLDSYAVTQIGAISNSSNQTIIIRAFK